MALVAKACSTGSDETVDLLEDPKIGLSHLNSELHAVKEMLAELTQQIETLQK